MTALVARSWFDESGEHHETKLADPRGTARAQPPTARTCRPRRRPAASVRAKAAPASSDTPSDDDGNRIVFTINGRLFLTDIDWNDETGAPEPHTRELAGVMAR